METTSSALTATQTGPGGEPPQAQSWVRLAQRVLGLVLRTDYLSSGRGRQQSRRVLAERSKRRRMQTAAEQHKHQSDEQRSAVQEHDAERAYLHQVALKERHTGSEEYQLAVRMRAGDMAARNALLEANLGLVVMFARRYRQTGVPLLELIAEGNLGLLAATREFDPEMGCRFATYAKWYVRQSIQRALPRLSSVVHAGHGGEDLAELHDEALLQSAATGTEATNANAAAPLLPEQDASIDALAIPEEEEPPQAALLQQRRDRLLRALARLDEREQIIVSERYALLDEQGSTLNELAGRFNVSIERVRQIESAAVRKLRAALNEAGESAETLL